MSPIGSFSTAENLQRLEEFPTFSSCIKCFGKPILPPLLTAKQREEISRIRAVTANKEADILRRKESLSEKGRTVHRRIGEHLSSEKESSKSYGMHFKHERVDALFPSPFNVCQDNFAFNKSVVNEALVTMSKIPTSGICSTVHKGVIVCPNVIGRTKRYTVEADNTPSSVPVSAVFCSECSHTSASFDCHLCQVENHDVFQNPSLCVELSPEVPYGTFFTQQKINFSDDEQSTIIEESECESLPPVVPDRKLVSLDTDSESNVTCATQSTDLEKYMDIPFDFSSPEGSGIVWESKMGSQHNTASKSDDASSETMVNTESELTPCASVMAELTDSVEDATNNTNDAKCNGIVDKDNAVDTRKRAHSVDSYLKILKTCARNLYVRKSQSEPSQSDINHLISPTNVIKSNLKSSKSASIVREDSKEGEDAEILPENSVPCNEDFKNIESSSNQAESFSGGNDSSVTQTRTNGKNVKKHIRRNSYTLDYPSPALITAHADCNCNLDAEKCSSPHCSASADQSASIINSAFKKEKVNILPPSPEKAKNFPILSSESSPTKTSFSSDVASSCIVIKTTTTTSTGQCSAKKTLKFSDEPMIPSQMPEKEDRACINCVESGKPDKIRSFTNFGDSKSSKSQDIITQIYHDLQESHKLRVKALLEEQNKQWQKLQEEFKAQEKLLCEKLNLLMSPTSIASDSECCYSTCCLPPCNFISEGVAEEQRAEERPCTIQSELSDLNKASSFATSSSQDIPTSVCPPQVPNISDNYKEFNIINSISQMSGDIESGDQFLGALSSPISVDYEGHNTYIPNVVNTEVIRKEQNISIGKFSGGECSILSSYHMVHFPNETEKTFHADQDGNISEICMSVACIDQPSSERHDSSLPHERTNSEISRDCSSRNIYSHQDINETVSKEITDQNELYHEDFHPPINNDSNISYSNYDQAISFVSSSSRTVKDPLVEAHKLDIIHHNSVSDGGSCLNECQNQTISCVPSKTQENLSMKTQNSASSASTNQTNRIFLGPSKTTLESNKSQSGKKHQCIPMPVSNVLSSIHILAMKESTSLSGAVSKEKPVVNIGNDQCILKKFEKLPAFIKGYLTRRLFKTERVQGLLKTLQDTAILIGKLSEDLSLKGDSVSECDVDFHRQLIVQLMTTFHNVYDIFCTISTKEKMNIIAESRNFRLKQKQPKELQQLPTIPVVAAKSSSPSLNKNHKLSSANLKALERKKRSVIDSRTYTVEDFKGFKLRNRSSMSSKPHSSSASSVYKVSVGVPSKKKTATGQKSSGSRSSLHPK